MSKLFQKIYDQSINNPEKFWQEASNDIFWFKKPTKILNKSNPPFYKWFEDGVTNTCYNALDIHIDQGRGKKTALIYDSPITGNKSQFSYEELRSKVSKFAGALKDQGVTKEYTSARLNSKFAFTYGRIEVKAKIPEGQGTWPAIWMLSKDIDEPGAYFAQEFGTTAWPDGGEIDILEHWGNNPNYAQSAIHSRSSFGGTVNHGGQSVATMTSDFHVYSLDWSADKMVFAVDGIEHYTYQPETKNDQTWPFDSDQYLLLNFAIESSIDTNFKEGNLDVDFVRIYDQSNTLIWSDEFD